MSDERLTRLLGALPRETAGDDFTRRILARLDEAERATARPDRAAWLGRLALPVAAAVVLVVALLARLEPSSGPPAGAAEARRLLEEIRREHGRLEGELAALRQDRGSPVLYLGGDEEVDLVLDLGRVRELPQGTARPAPAREEIRTTAGGTRL
jgi:hypothetical protein